MGGITSDIPREKLKELVARDGEALLRDRDRCEALLKDYCGAHRREISALVGALEERIPLELKSSWQVAMTPEAMRGRLVQRLEENRGLAPEVAGWAVDAWSYALGVGLARRSERVDEVANGGAAEAAAGTWTSGPPRVQPAERVASRRAGDAAARIGAQSPRALSIVQRSTIMKAGLGAAAALVLGIAAFGVIKYYPAPQHSALAAGPAPVSVADPKPNLGAIQAPSHDNPIATGEGAAKDVPAPLLLPSGTVVSVRLDAPVNSDQVNVGALADATVNSPIIVDGNLVVSPGAKAKLQVTALVRTATEGGAEHLQLSLVELATKHGVVKVTASPKQFDGPTIPAERTKRGIGAAAGAVGGFVTGKLFHHGGSGAKPQPVTVTDETPIHFRLSAGVKPPPETTARK